MTEKELIERLNRMGPTDRQMDRMLERILNPATKRKSIFKSSYRIALPALAILLLVPLFWPPSTQQEPIQELTPIMNAATPFAGPRGGMALHPGSNGKVLNYNGSRYTFLENGAAYDLSGWGIEAQPALGTLQYDMSADIQDGGKEGYSSRDLAATYMLGGTLYELPGYDPAFRLVVSHEGRTYIAQLSGLADGSVIDAGDYVSLADLKRLAKRIELLNGDGTLAQAWDEKKDIRRWISIISDSKAAETSNEMAESQTSGKSYQLKWRLLDGTSITMNLAPELSQLTIGTGRYELSKTFIETYGTIFHITD